MYLRDYILELQIQLMVLDLLWHVVRDGIPQKSPIYTGGGRRIRFDLTSYLLAFKKCYKIQDSKDR